MSVSPPEPDAPAPRLSVIVPAFNEENLIESHLRSLLGGLPPGAAQIIVVCNGCTDGTVGAARRVRDPAIRVVEVPTASKAMAIAVGERMATAMPRFYVDADVRLCGPDLLRLGAELRAPSCELVSPRIVFDLGGASWAARRVSSTWLRLPHGRSEAFHHVLGVSAAGRRRWGRFPGFVADDAFILSRVPAGARRIVLDAKVIVRPPRTWWAWVRVRERWLRGTRELRRAGIRVPRTAGQRGESLRLLCRPADCPAGLLYLGAMACARALALIPRRDAAWFQDRTSRGAPVGPPSHGCGAEREGGVGFEAPRPTRAKRLEPMHKERAR